jgi:hypothetical protein
MKFRVVNSLVAPGTGRSLNGQARERAALEKRHALRPGVSREMVVVSGHVPQSDLAALKVDGSRSEAGFTGQRR